MNNNGFFIGCLLHTLIGSGALPLYNDTSILPQRNQSAFYEQVSVTSNETQESDTTLDDYTDVVLDTINSFVENTRDTLFNIRFRRDVENDLNQPNDLPIPTESDVNSDMSTTNNGEESSNTEGDVTSDTTNSLDLKLNEKYKENDNFKIDVINEVNVDKIDQSKYVITNEDVKTSKSNITDDELDSVSEHVIQNNNNIDNSTDHKFNTFSKNGTHSHNLSLTYFDDNVTNNAFKNSEINDKSDNDDNIIYGTNHPKASEDFNKNINVIIGDKSSKINISVSDLVKKQKTDSDIIVFLIVKQPL